MTSVLKMTGSTRFKYIKGKRHKFGIKLFKICLPGGYTNKIKIYCGKEKVNGQPVAERGRTLITDNWYTSVNLAETLQTRSTHLIGTLRKNRKNLPKDVVEAKLKKGEIVAKQNKKNVVVMKWQDKRDVLFLSTKHKDDMIEVTHREGPKRKPAAIIEYNNAKSFIRGQLTLAHYASPSKWYRKVAFELITGTSVVNALIIFNKINQTKISVTKFKETVCMQLLQSSNPPLPIQVQQKHELTQNALNKRGRCTICYKRNSELHGRDYAVKNTKRIIYVCNGCEGNPFICLDCFFVNHVFMKRN
nr:unnamed protein product [Callosobruchus chinensis]